MYLIDKMIEHVKGYKDLMAYIACFSESDDYLAQWRGYADNGRGVAIGFDVETIERLIEQIPDAQLEFRKVHYICLLYTSISTIKSIRSNRGPLILL